MVEKHKDNFLALHGPFSDKPSENIIRWIEKADAYQQAHIIKSLEMASIVIYCIRGEPAIKIRCMLDVPGTKYKHSNHYSEQPQQKSVDYMPYREHIPKSASQPEEVLSRPAIMPMRAELVVDKEKCLRFYLLEIYKKKVNLTDAEKFLATFKVQKPKQTCSNFIDQFIIYYENYSHQRWTEAQRAANKEAREAEMMQLITNGICKEFKVHCDNVEFDIYKAKLDLLVSKVVEWQRGTTTGRTFTAECTQEKLPNAMASALELEDYFNTPAPDPIIEEAKVSATQATSTASRGQRGGRGAKGSNRGARGSGRGRGRGANTSSAGAPRYFVSRDVMDGNIPNYKQTPEGNLHKSFHGFPLCNYCGRPSHKRQHCPMKLTNRQNGSNRLYHPDREKNIAMEFQVNTSSSIRNSNSCSIACLPTNASNAIPTTTNSSMATMAGVPSNTNPQQPIY